MSKSEFKSKAVTAAPKSKHGAGDDRGKTAGDEKGKSGTWDEKGKSGAGDCQNKIGSVGPPGPIGLPGPGCSMLTYASGTISLVDVQSLPALLSNPSGIGIMVLGQTNGFVVINRTQPSLDAIFNAYASTAPRAGTLSQLIVRTRFQFFPGNVPLDNAISFTFTIYTAPTSIASNDFKASALSASITLPKGTTSPSGTPLYFTANDNADKVTISAGQRILMLITASYTPVNNAAGVLDIASFDASIAFA